MDRNIDQKGVLGKTSLTVKFYFKTYKSHSEGYISKPIYHLKGGIQTQAQIPPPTVQRSPFLPFKERSMFTSYITNVCIKKNPPIYNYITNTVYSNERKTKIRQKTIPCPPPLLRPSSNLPLWNHVNDGGDGDDGSEINNINVNLKTTTALPRILLVDDDIGLLKAVSRYLESKNVYEIYQATGWQSALPYLSNEDMIDLIVLDVNMPSVDGYEFIERVRSIGPYQDIPVIFLTARAMVKDRIKGYDLGANSYLTKPFDPEELVSIINSLLMQREAILRVEGNRVQTLKNEMAKMKEELEITILKRKEEEEAQYQRQQEIEVKRKKLGENGALFKLDSPVYFTDREQEILNLLCRGFSNGEIAEQLNITKKYVEQVVSKLFSKTGANTRTELVRIALDNQLITE